MSAWQHTPGASGDDMDSEFVDHCIDCSEAAGEWVGWPCSAAKLVKAAVEVDRYLRGMDEEARIASARAVAWDEGYHRGVRDEAGDIERADNPYRSEPVDPHREAWLRTARANLAAAGGIDGVLAESFAMDIARRGRAEMEGREVQP